VDAIENQRAKIEAGAQAEDARWHKQKGKLEKALHRARSSSNVSRMKFT